jgi:hypothetical protein
MIFIYLIILVISINGIIPTNITKKSSSNRVLIIPSCQANKTESESSKKLFYTYSRKNNQFD